MAGDVLGVSYPAEGGTTLRVGVVAGVGPHVFELTLVQEDHLVLCASRELFHSLLLRLWLVRPPQCYSAVVDVLRGRCKMMS